MGDALAGKVVVVTGASIGIGRETALQLAAAGCRLALTYCEHRAEAEQVAARCRDAGAPEVLVAPLELADDASIDGLVETVGQRFGEVDTLVNNAGVVVWGRFCEQSYADIERQLAVNLTGTIKLTWALLPMVRETVVFIGSTAALHGTATLAPYCASKWGLRGFAKALAKEQRELRIVSVHPTVTATRMNDFRGMPPERVAEVVLRVLRGEIPAESGADVDVREHVPG